MLASRDWVYWSSLFGPVFAYNLTLKLGRVSSIGALHPSLVGSLLYSDLAFNAGLALFWLGDLVLVRRTGALRSGVLVLMSFTALVYVVVTTGANRYFEKMGSVLDFSLVRVAARDFTDVRPVMASETPWLGFAVVIGYTCLGPALITWLANRAGFVSPRIERPRSPLWGVVACLAGALGLVLATHVAPTPVSKSFALDPLAHMVVSAMRHPPISEASSIPLVVSATGARLQPRESVRLRNLVVIILESTGAEVSTPYSGRFAVTPFLAELSKRSLLVKRAYTTVPHTSKALVSILCGIYPLPSRALVESLPGRIPSTCLPELFGRQGYRTAFFEPATKAFENRPGMVRNFGFQDFFPGESMDAEGFEPANYFGAEDAVMLEPSRRWLENLGGKTPFFATYLTNTAHHDYLAPKRYGLEPFVEDDEHNRYLNAVRYQDFFLRDLLAQYRKLGLVEETVFIVVGDHGEAFGEHVRKKHDDVPYEEVARVPFLLVVSGLAPEKLEGPASLLDVLPTGVDLAGFDLVGAHYPGRSILRIPEDRTLWLSCFDDLRCLARLEGHEKYIYFFDDQPDELYDLSQDPLERVNLASERPDVTRRRRMETLAWRSAMHDLYGAASR